MGKLKDESLYDKAAMRIILQPVVEEEIAEFDEWNKIPHEYSPEFKRGITRIFRHDRLKRNYRKAAVYGRRVVVGLAVIVTLALVACAAIEPIREKIAEAIVTWYEKRNEVVYEMTKEVGEPMLPTFVPDGYEVVYYDVTDELAVIEYDNGSNSYAFMRTKNRKDKKILVDNEQRIMEEIAWGDDKAIYFKPNTAEDRYMLMWEKDGYIYVVDSDISKEEMLVFAEGVK